MRNASLIISFFLLSTLLVGCVKMPVSQNEGTSSLHIFAVEYYSRAPVSNVQIVLKDDVENGAVDKQYVDKEGKATFDNLKDGLSYTAYIYRVINKEYVIQSTHTFRYDETVRNLFLETANPNSSSGIAVPLVKQNPELPNGCEITSLTAILNYYGEEVNKQTMTDEYLPKEPLSVVNGKRIGPDPNVSFVGNPSDNINAFYVFASPIVQAANAYIKNNDLNRIAYDITGTSIDQLQSYILKGIPVLTWITIDLQPARVNESLKWKTTNTLTEHVPYTNLHAVVLLGLDSTYAHVMNPLTGYESIPITVFKQSFETLQSRAVVVY